MKICGSNEVSVEFHSPEIDSEEWVGCYSVSLFGRALEATVRVCNSPYGESPSDYFSSLADNWQGWGGAKTWSAMEGEYQMSAVSDKTGHVALTIRVWSLKLESSWSSEVEMIVESGQLEAIARDFHGFFYPGAE